MLTAPLDWALHAGTVCDILRDLDYLVGRGVAFYLEGFTIHRKGGWPYSPSEINSFDDALSVLRDNGAACTAHFDAICLLQGVSYHGLASMDRGRELLVKLLGKAAQKEL